MPILDIILSITDKLFITIMVTLAVSSFRFWIFPPNPLNAQMRILQPAEIGPALIAARTKTDRWWYSGTSARYTRNQTLPNLAEECYRSRRSIEIVIQMLNPNNILACTQYAQYRQGLRIPPNVELPYNTVMGKSLNIEKGVRLELLSTIVSAFIWKTQQPLLKIRIGLKDHFSLLRMDISTTRAILTKENPQDPAILYEHGTFFYDAYYQDLILGFDQCISLDMTKPFVQEDHLTVSEITNLLISLGLYTHIDDNDIQAIQQIVKNRRNPYSST
jgi:hypothetical protein